MKTVSNNSNGRFEKMSKIILRFIFLLDNEKYFTEPRNKDICVKYFCEDVSVAELKKEYKITSKRIYDILNKTCREIRRRGIIAPKKNKEGKPDLEEELIKIFPFPKDFKKLLEKNNLKTLENLKSNVKNLKQMGFGFGRITRLKMILKIKGIIY